jgi:hypothetical protein
LPGAQGVDDTSTAVDATDMSNVPFWTELARTLEIVVDCHLLTIDGENFGGSYTTRTHIRTGTGNTQDIVYILGVRTAISFLWFRVVPRPTSELGAFLAANTGSDLCVLVPTRDFATLRNELLWYGYANRFCIDNNLR